MWSQKAVMTNKNGDFVLKPVDNPGAKMGDNQMFEHIHFDLQEIRQQWAPCNKATGKLYGKIWKEN